MLPDLFPEEENGNPFSLNAPTGAWCSLTITDLKVGMKIRVSQCAYRCVVLPDLGAYAGMIAGELVSMHLQVRGAP